MKKKNNTPKRGSGRKRLSQNRRKALSRFEHLETRTLLAADLNTWHNTEMANDVNADGLVNEMDQTILVAELNANGNRYLGAPVSTGILEGEQSLFIDVNNDNSVSPLDLLMVSDMLALEAEAAASFTAEYTLVILDDTGAPITPTNGNEYTVQPNDVFTLVAFVKDTSDDGTGTDPSGFLQAYIDVSIVADDPSYQTLASSLIVGTNQTSDGDDAFMENPAGYDNILPEDLNGLGIDNMLRGMGGGDPRVGTTGSANGDPTQPFQLFSLQFTAGETGEIVFTGSEADSRSDINDVFIPNFPNINLFSTITFDSSEELRSSSIDSMPQVIVKISEDFTPGEVNAFSDSYSVSEDLRPESTDPPTTLHTDGLEYIVLDVKVNDSDPNGVLLTGDRSASVLFQAINVFSGNLSDLDTRVIFQSSSDGDIFDLSGNKIQDLSDNYFLYRPQANFSGSETFSYILGEAGVPNNVDSGTVTINISNVDDAPVAVDDGSELDPIFANPGETIFIDVLANDFLQGGVNEIEELVLVSAQSTGDPADARFDISTRLAIVETINADGTISRKVRYTAPAIPRNEVFEYTIADGFDDPDDLTDPTTYQQATARVYVKTLSNTSASGQFFFDANNNGVHDENLDNDASPEMLLGGVTVTLKNLNDANAPEIVTTSNADGTFSFERFDTGQYSVTASHPNFVMTNADISIQDIDANSASFTEDLGGLGFRGLAYDYRSFASHIASNTEDSIMFAVNMTNGVVDLNLDGSASLEWYSVDEGWERLISIDSIFYNADTDSGLVLLTLSGENAGDPNMQASLGFSSSTSGFQLLGETGEGVVFRLNGSADTVLTDAVFATL
ncbi:MAG: hypothetical protein COA78_23725 [Blastopirellula sp.]|nr:MAG: hypothetical protein COA78_23725 [Blastopirellula sp.]